MDYVQGLWVGGKLTQLERLSIASFLKHGHEYRLYTYGDVDNAPPGTTICDASDILPRTNVFLSHGSYAPFSDLFRYKLLSNEGGWWVDLDVVCIRQFEFHDRPYVFGSEYDEAGGPAFPAIGVMKAPRKSPFFVLCYQIACDMNPSNSAFGEIGFHLFRKHYLQYGLGKFIEPPSTFHPIEWWNLKKYIEPNSAGIKFPVSYAHHLYGHMWRSNGLDRDGRYDETSLFAQMVKTYLPEH